MINNITIKNFKCFEEERLDLASLTILAGNNSVGKSSVIQAINIAIRSQRSPTVLAQFGDFNDIKNRYTNPSVIEISLNDGNIKATITKDAISYSNDRTIDISYLNANRVGISSINEYQTYSTKEEYNSSGAYSVGFFEKNKNEQILGKLQKQEANSLTLDGQLNYWLCYISDLNLSFDTQEIDSKAHAFYKIEKIQDKIKPENVGTGLNYLVTMITACLLAKDYTTIIIENPEIHLHPLAQAKLGEFFAFVASQGIQLIIETHNDHIINSICYQEFKKNIKSSDVAIQYKSNISTPFEKIEVKNGQFVNHQGENRFPEGFFDATLQEIFEING